MMKIVKKLSLFWNTFVLEWKNKNTCIEHYDIGFFKLFSDISQSFFLPFLWTCIKSSTVAYTCFADTYQNVGDVFKRSLHVYVSGEYANGTEITITTTIVILIIMMIFVCTTRTRNGRNKCAKSRTRMSGARAISCSTH